MFIGTEAAIHFGSQALHLAGGVGPAVSKAGLGERFGAVMSLVGLGGAFSFSSHKIHVAEREAALEGRLRRELAAYLTSDLCPRTMVQSEFGRLMSQTIATRSSFARAAVLLQDSTGTLSVVGSAGVDDLSVLALNRWGAKVAAQGAAKDGEKEQLGERVGVCSFAVQMERRLLPGRSEASSMSCTRVYITPMRSATGLVGALVVCAEQRPSVRELARGEAVARLVEPLEALALRLTLQLTRTTRRTVPLSRTATPIDVQEQARERVADQDSPAVEEHQSPSLRQLISMTHGSEVLAMPQRSDRVMGFPPARIWHNSPVSGGLAALPGGISR